MKEIRFVDVGEGITEGHIQAWSVKDGDVVKEDQAVVTVETDKAVVNVPAPIGGIIRIVAPAGTTLHIGDTLAGIGTPEEMKAYRPGKNAAQREQQPAQAAAQQKQPPAAQTTAQQQSQPLPQQPTALKEIIATPAVRKLARDMNLDISRITGTGPGGRILENDVRSAGGAGKPAVAQRTKFSETLEAQHKEEIERQPMTTTRKAIARNMEESWKIPRAVHMDLINATTLWNIVSVEKPKVLKELNVKITFLPFIIKATVEALKENPRFNASYDHETSEIIIKKYYNIGLAAEAPDGLKVVVIRDADKKSIVEIAKEIQSLHEKIMNNTITLAEMRDSTFTITNIGSLGGGYLSVPMINPNEAGILGIHIIRDAPVVVDGKIVVGKVLPFSLSFDHRIVDGADAVKFGNAIIRYLEDPNFLEMLG
ncbi:MAG: 2-oxo acid dehydrogenase subunit E2 [Candidatus Micrarchaeales archaeon]|nr:2-oxo acid dehydrogenase subunit E2 [Candidatus Micrarchaeales archaeon]